MSMSRLRGTYQYREGTGPDKVSKHMVVFVDSSVPHEVEEVTAFCKTKEDAVLICICLNFCGNACAQMVGSLDNLFTYHPTNDKRL